MTDTNTAPEPPRFKHDCDACKYLGRYTARHIECDLYYCPVGGAPDTVIARYGDEGSWYTSGIALAGSDPRLAEAKRRAIAAGLLPAEASVTVTIAEVAAKLGLKQDGATWVGMPQSGRILRLYVDGTARVTTFSRGRDSQDYTPREVCELAGVDYERYEGREPEPVSVVTHDWMATQWRWDAMTIERLEKIIAFEFAKEDNQSLTVFELAGALLYARNHTRSATYHIGLEAGRAEGAAMRAELLAVCKLVKTFGQKWNAQTVMFDGDLLEIQKTAIAAIARAQAAEEAE